MIHTPKLHHPHKLEAKMNTNRIKILQEGTERLPPKLQSGETQNVTNKINTPYIVQNFKLTIQLISLQSLS